MRQRTCRADQTFPESSWLFQIDSLICMIVRNSVAIWQKSVVGSAAKNPLGLQISRQIAEESFEISYLKF